MSSLDFDSDLYYFNYGNNIINAYNIDTSTPLLIKLDKTIFEKGKIYEYDNSSHDDLYILEYNKPKSQKNKGILSYTMVDASNSYSEGKYIYINMKPDSYLVLVKRK